MIRGFFFDLDGTLVNTYEADFLAYRDAIREVLGITVEQQDFITTHGRELQDKLRLLGIEAGEDDVKKIAQVKKNQYSKYMHLTEANQFLVEFLAKFSKHHSMALVTTAKKDNALSVLKQHGLVQFFSCMVFGDEVERPKPAPDPYLLALHKSGLKPEEVVAFEDSNSGIVSAESAGIAVIRVRNFSDVA